MRADRSFQLSVTISDTCQDGEVTSGRVAGDDNFFSRQLPFAAARTEKADGGLDIVDLCGKSCLRGKPVVHAGDGVSLVDERPERHASL